MEAKTILQQRICCRLCSRGQSKIPSILTQIAINETITKGRFKYPYPASGEAGLEASLSSGKTSTKNILSIPLIPSN